MRSSKSISSSTIRKLIFASALCALAAGCHLSNGKGRPSISFTTVPAADKGGPDVLTRIEGKVSGARPGQSIVVYARSGVWFLQPSANEPFAHIQSDSRWQESTHFGTEYAAFLVEQDYRPPATTDVLPKLGGAIVAMATVRGAPPSGPIHRTLRFSGYEWIVR
ncbi:MAG TPA: hypothetical protein VEZ90_13085, partial [Blastocatellia bacterium]|nr:hypothetical protein [Blastocatellia bacterium]